MGGSGSGSCSSQMVEISKFVSVNKLHRESLISSSEVGKESGREGGGWGSCSSELSSIEFLERVKSKIFISNMVTKTVKFGVNSVHVVTH